MKRAAALSSLLFLAACGKYDNTTSFPNANVSAPVKATLDFKDCARDKLKDAGLLFPDAYNAPEVQTAISLQTSVYSVALPVTTTTGEGSIDAELSFTNVDGKPLAMGAGDFTAFNHVSRAPIQQTINLEGQTLNGKPFMIANPAATVQALKGIDACARQGVQAQANNDGPV